MIQEHTILIIREGVESDNVVSSKIAFSVEQKTIITVCNCIIRDNIVISIISSPSKPYTMGIVPNIIVVYGVIRSNEFNSIVIIV